MANPLISLFKAHPLFDALSWVASARSVDETRHFMSGLLVENEGKDQLYIATDGRQLRYFRHVGKKGLYPAGNARIESLSKASLIFEPDCADMGQFPNWRRVVPTMEGAKALIDADGLPIILESRAATLRYAKGGTLALSYLLASIYQRANNRIIDATYALGLASTSWRLYGEPQANRALECHEYDASKRCELSRIAVIMPGQPLA
jgi:hypothetical protein